MAAKVPRRTVLAGEALNNAKIHTQQAFESGNNLERDSSTGVDQDLQEQNNAIDPSHCSTMSMHCACLAEQCLQAKPAQSAKKKVYGGM